MLKELQLSLLVILLLSCGFLYQLTLKSSCLFSCLPPHKSQQAPEALLGKGRGIVFLETSERTEPSPLVSCAVESAAKVYPKQPVVLFMKGLSSMKLPPNSTYPAFSLLSAIDNVFLIPLDMKSLFEDTPLSSWYTQINASAERNWLHVSSDASRLAIIWKYGGVYMDTDIISIRPIPAENFLAAQASRYSSNGVFGFLPRHAFLWQCMENFVEHYNSYIWGNQGPDLMTRMLRVWCKLEDFQELSDLRCLNVSFLHPQRFYPISYPEWRRYYEVWSPEPSFNDSYALHLWNYMNQERKGVVRGSNTLVENLYRKHCPRTYRDLIRGPEGLVAGESGTGSLNQAVLERHIRRPGAEYAMAVLARHVSLKLPGMEASCKGELAVCLVNKLQMDCLVMLYSGPSLKSNLGENQRAVGPSDGPGGAPRESQILRPVNREQRASEQRKPSL